MPYTIRFISNPLDPTFNQLLGVNEYGAVVGYYGSGAPGHPNKGYQTNPLGSAFVPENFPFSVQTQVTGINDSGWTVGFEVDAAGNSVGFLDIGGRFSLAPDPLAPVLNGVVNEQLLGVNDSGIAVGFYSKDTAGDAAAFTYNVATNAYTALTVTGATSVTATGIDQGGDISGFFTNTSGATFGFAKMANGTLIALDGPAGASNVQALGINDAGLVVGSYTTSTNTTDGFSYNINTGLYTSYSYRAGTQTVLNGVDDKGDIVGFTMTANGNTQGFFMTPTAPALTFTFQTLDDSADPTFNQLLAINNCDQIVGYFGSGAAGHPNQGYELINQTTFNSLNYPLSVQTQETGINNSGATVGFEVDAAGNSLGFYQKGGVFQALLDPNAVIAGGLVAEQFLGINDRGQIAGFYQNAAGADVGFIYNQNNNAFGNVAITGAKSVTATDISDNGYISGFYTNSAGSELGFLKLGTAVTTISGATGDTAIQVLGVNNAGYAVGSFMNNAGTTEGFLYNIATKAFTALADPLGAQGTVLNGINDLNQITGFFTDAAGNTHGLVATPSTLGASFR